MTTTTTGDKIAQAIAILEDLEQHLNERRSNTAAALETLTKQLRDDAENNGPRTLPRGTTYQVEAINIYAQRLAADDIAELSVYYKAATPRNVDDAGNPAPSTGRVTYKLQTAKGSFITFDGKRPAIYVCERDAPTWWNGSRFAPLSPGALNAIEHDIYDTVVDVLTHNNETATVAAMIDDAHDDAKRNRTTSALAQARHKISDVARQIDR